MLQIQKNFGLNATVPTLLSILTMGYSSLALGQYSVQSLGDLSPTAINDSDQVAGYVLESNGPSSALADWNNGSVMQLLPNGVLNGEGVAAINSSGQVAGWGGTSVPRQTLAFLWDPKHGFIDYAVPSGYQAEMWSINDLGQVAGTLYSLGAAFSPIVWTSPQSPVTLSLPEGYTDGIAMALNDAGQTVGYTDNDGSPNPPKEDAVLWQNGTVVDLTPTFARSFADGINNLGQVIGSIYPGMDSDVIRSFEWNAAGGLTILPDGGYGSDAEAINNLGQIVGYVFGEDAGFGAIWENGVLYNLNELLPPDSGWVLDGATGINDSGQIVGDGMYDGQQEGYLLTPIPEPAAISLAAGFCLLAGRRRK